jgi:hypothetical protein
MRIRDGAHIQHFVFLAIFFRSSQIHQEQKNAKFLTYP